MQSQLLFAYCAQDSRTYRYYFRSFVIRKRHWLTIFFGSSLYSSFQSVKGRDKMDYRLYIMGTFSQVMDDTWENE